MQAVAGAKGKIVGLAEWDGGLVDESGNGLDIEAIKEYHSKKGTITGFPGAKTVRELLHKKVHMKATCAVHTLPFFVDVVSTASFLPHFFR